MLTVLIVFLGITINQIEGGEDQIKCSSLLLGNYINNGDHQLFDELLSKYVTNGKVDYKGLKKNEDRLDQYLAYLQKKPPQSNAPDNVKLAYWINAYNAYTIKLILDHYPVNSITDIHDGNPWDVKWIPLDGKSLSLNMIEHEIIRPTFQEPRIHFAVNCAALSCPPLASKAYTGENLEYLLESQTRDFINDPVFNNINRNKLVISKIFKWYQEDFDDMVSFINKYSKKNIKEDVEITYKEYNWALNSK